MEIVFANHENPISIQNKVIGFYGDILDLVTLGVDVEGIIYQDNWTVKRFLNGFHFKLNRRIKSILKYLDIKESYLNTELKDLSKENFKYVLLAYLLIKNKKIIIFDHFEIGLTYKEQKKFLQIVRNLKKDGLSVILVSKNLVLMSQVVDLIHVMGDEDLIYSGSISELINQKKCIVDEPNIIKFIKKANKRGANLDYTLDSRELLKSIYRSVY